MPLLLSFRAQVQGFADGKGMNCGVGSGSCTPAAYVGSVVTQPLRVCFLNYKMGLPFPSHQAVVEIIDTTVSVPFFLRFSLPEVFLPLFAWLAPIHPSESLGPVSPPPGSPPWSLVLA